MAVLRELGIYQLHRHVDFGHVIAWLSFFIQVDIEEHRGTGVLSSQKAKEMNFSWTRSLSPPLWSLPIVECDDCFLPRSANQTQRALLLDLIAPKDGSNTMKHTVSMPKIFEQIEGFNLEQYPQSKHLVISSDTGWAHPMAHPQVHPIKTTQCHLFCQPLLAPPHRSSEALAAMALAGPSRTPKQTPPGLTSSNTPAVSVACRG